MRKVGEKGGQEDRLPLHQNNSKRARKEDSAAEAEYPTAALTVALTVALTRAQRAKLKAAIGAAQSRSAEEPRHASPVSGPSGGAGALEVKKDSSVPLPPRATPLAIPIVSAPSGSTDAVEIVEGSSSEVDAGLETDTVNLLLLANRFIPASADLSAISQVETNLAKPTGSNAEETGSELALGSPAERAALTLSQPSPGFGSVPSPAQRTGRRANSSKTRAKAAATLAALAAATAGTSSVQAAASQASPHSAYHYMPPPMPMSAYGWPWPMLWPYPPYAAGTSSPGMANPAVASFAGSASHPAAATALTAPIATPADAVVSAIPTAAPTSAGIMPPTPHPPEAAWHYYPPPVPWNPWGYPPNAWGPWLWGHPDSSPAPQVALPSAASGKPAVVASKTTAAATLTSPQTLFGATALASSSTVGAKDVAMAESSQVKINPDKAFFLS